MDLIGCFTYAVPGLGELGDIIWAPVSAIIFFFSFGAGWKSLFGGIFNFTEEILPGTDFIPTFTIAWLINYFAGRKKNSGMQSYKNYPVTNR
jgi:hypothetical protein